MKLTTILRLFGCAAAAASLLSCGNGSDCIFGSKDNYVIGISQCSEDSWRQKLKEELEMATYFNEGVTLRFVSANDDSELQQRQIDSLAESGIDLLIVSPNQLDLLSDEIDKVYDAGIPVILFDRKTDSPKYTSFVGADNFQIGEMIGHFLAGKLGGKGNVVEIAGLSGSSPALERHNGFAKAIGEYPGIRIVGFANGDWTQESGEAAMSHILESCDEAIDAVFGGNDRMAAGARNAVLKAGIKGDIMYFGVDALPSGDGGMRMVADSVLTASAIYPTHGTELLLLALDILRGKEYARETMMRSSIVTQENAEILLLQYEEVLSQSEYLKMMHRQVGRMHDSIKLQQIIIGIVLLFLVVFVILMIFYVRAYRQKLELSEILQEEMEKVERQRDELEEQRDKLIELSIAGQNAEDEDDGGDAKRDAAFIRKFTKLVEDRMSNSELSVEDLSSELCVSRVQLYRKIKSVTGKSPVEIIRQLRLTKADRLLSETSMSISEIAYSVGFSSPSYFSKCYRDYFGKIPTDRQKA